MVSELNKRIEKCEKICSEKPSLWSNNSSITSINMNSNSGGSSPANLLHNQNLESIGKNFAQIQNEFKRINSFIDVF